ncbi:MAG: nucleotide exchange factor GrpE [Candidatus Micrarchaeota archaeon]
MVDLIEQKKDDEKNKKQHEQPEEIGKQETDLKQAKIEELTELVKRIQAEFENFKKREEKDRMKFVEYSNAGLMLDLLPVLDSIESGEKNWDEKTINAFEPIKKQLTEVLKKNGLKEINSKGKKFDPEIHDCLMQEHNEKKEDYEVLEELQKGYFLKDKVLRHSKVKINRKPEKETENKQEKTEEETGNQKTMPEKE